MSTASRGSARERQVRAIRTGEGWTVERAAGSKGITGADLICMRKEWPHQPSRTEVMLSQIKANKGSPWMNFRKAERDSLRAAAAMIGATAELVHWPPNGEMRVYTPDEWPS